MSHDDDAATRFPHDRWFTGPGSSGARFIGTVIGLALILPTIPATLLERAAGDVVVVIACAAVATAAAVGAVTLFRRRLRVLAGFAASLAVGCTFAAVISAVMDW